MKQIRKRLTYANVMSSIAVFLVLGGATAFAAGKITAKQLQSNSVTTAKIKKSAITASKIKNGAVTTSKLGGGSVTASNLAAGAVSAASLASGSVGATQIANGAVSASKLAPGTLNPVCPSGTTSVGGLCFETSERGAATFVAAVEACTNSGRMLPPAADLIGFAKKSALPNQEWSGSLYDNTEAFTVESDGTPNEETFTQTFAFRCVAQSAP